MKTVHAPNTFPAYLDSLSDIATAYPVAGFVVAVAATALIASYLVKG